MIVNCTFDLEFLVESNSSRLFCRVSAQKKKKISKLQLELQTVARQFFL